MRRSAAAAETGPVRAGRSLISHWPVAACLLAIGLVVLQSLYLRWTLDDAYIAFAYAQNWVQGQGLVFNVGERVEGYTCFLWVVLSALGLALGANIVWWSMGWGILAAAATVVVTWHLVRELVPARMHGRAVAGALLVGGYPAVAWWAASGMETMLFTALVTTAMWRHLRHGAASTVAPVCLALASMTRPEGCLLAAVLCLDAFHRDSWRAALRYAGLFLAIFAPYYTWRLWYYGHPVPNTFYAKVGLTPAQPLRGLRYVKTFLMEGSGGWLLAGSVLALGTGIARRAAALYVFLLAYVAYIVLVGGDAFLFHRFFVPAVPALAALSVGGILRAADRIPGRRWIADAGCVLFLLVCAGACVPLLREERSFLPVARFGDVLNRAVAAFVREHTAADEAVATIGIGAVKFYGGRTVIDMVGLTDEHIARQPVRSLGQGLAGHERYDSQYVLARRPRYIVITPENDTAAFAAAADMWRQPLFKRCYAADKVGYRRIDGCAGEP